MNRSAQNFDDSSKTKMQVPPIFAENPAAQSSCAPKQTPQEEQTKKCSFLEDVRFAVKELEAAQKELCGKEEHVKSEAKQLLSNLKDEVGQMKKRLEEILASKEIENTETHKDENSIVSFVQNRVDAIKPFFEQAVENFKGLPVKLGDEFDIAALKVKVAAIYARIFIRKKAHEVAKEIKEVVGLK